MSIGLITGSGSHALPGFDTAESVGVETPYGHVSVQRGRLGGVDALQVSRHGPGHARLSNLVNHRANTYALKRCGASAVIGVTACGAVDPALELGQLIVFDDLLFLANRLPDGSLCTFFDTPGDRARGHWILHGGPYAATMGRALADAATDAGLAVRVGGCYGHVDGPRFNTPAEIAQLAAAGVVAVSQTGGPETVLCGELELPYALLGYVTDHANEVHPGATTPVEVLVGLLGASSGVVAEVLTRALPRIAVEPPSAAGTLYRFEP
ncbi:MTAP family purine nucleoside phosphorylase [Conexibacter sp. DBS9H8]|uniref:MTAP family purine nucleoside phosphorylase n=1 Tax=Conexibacter sp. DBS9H8 TaxID=2937801 RepID=UPI00200E8276|nr:MTAP family purine nucleoside phosphorylase [Conexibacter sp. DBS9H8]